VRDPAVDTTMTVAVDTTTAAALDTMTRGAVDTIIAGGGRVSPLEMLLIPRHTELILNHQMR
jgi:hypothetical protein